MRIIHQKIEGRVDTDECSKTSPWTGKKEEEYGDLKGKIYEFKHKDGGSSSNSTIEENENKPSVRPYALSKMPRLRWTPDLHLRFIHAVERLGGQDRATPKLVLQLMNIKGLNIAHVKSHLQMYRSKKIDVPCHGTGIVDRIHILEGADQNLYNLSRLPMLLGFNPNHKSSFRYGDASWNGLGDLMQSCAMGENFNNTRPGFNDIFTGKNCVSWNHNLCSELVNPNLRSSSWQANELQLEILQSLPKKECQGGHEFKSSKQMQSRVQDLISSSNKGNPSDIGSSSMSLEKLGGVKRKAANCNIQLSLSLGLGRSCSNGYKEQEDLDDEDDDSRLSLSLWSSQCFSKQRRLIGNTSSENVMGASTLDLTL